MKAESRGVKELRLVPKVKGEEREEKVLLSAEGGWQVMEG